MSRRKQIDAPKPTPSLKDRLEGLGFESVRVIIEGGVTYVAMTWGGEPVRVAAYPLDDPFEIAKGWAAHQRA